MVFYESERTVYFFFPELGIYPSKVLCIGERYACSYYSAWASLRRKKYFEELTEGLQIPPDLSVEAVKGSVL